MIELSPNLNIDHSHWRPETKIMAGIAAFFVIGYIFSQYPSETSNSLTDRSIVTEATFLAFSILFDAVGLPQISRTQTTIHKNTEDHEIPAPPSEDETTSFSAHILRTLGPEKLDQAIQEDLTKASQRLKEALPENEDEEFFDTFQDAQEAANFFSNNDNSGFITPTESLDDAPAQSTSYPLNNAEKALVLAKKESIGITQEQFQGVCKDVRKLICIAPYLLSKNHLQLRGSSLTAFLEKLPDAQHKFLIEELLLEKNIPPARFWAMPTKEQQKFIETIEQEMIQKLSHVERFTRTERK